MLVTVTASGVSVVTGMVVVSKTTWFVEVIVVVVEGTSVRETEPMSVIQLNPVSEDDSWRLLGKAPAMAAERRHDSVRALDSIFKRMLPATIAVY